jgi:hypothetical protein
MPAPRKDRPPGKSTSPSSTRAIFGMGPPSGGAAGRRPPASRTGWRLSGTGRGLKTNQRASLAVCRTLGSSWRRAGRPPSVCSLGYTFRASTASRHKEVRQRRRDGGLRHSHAKIALGEVLTDFGRGGAHGRNLKCAIQHKEDLEPSDEIISFESSSLTARFRGLTVRTVALLFLPRTPSRACCIAD